MNFNKYLYITIGIILNQLAFAERLINSFDVATKLILNLPAFEKNYKSNNFHWNISQQGPVLGINLPIF
ncbi:hypothetical protein ACG9X6_17290 [Acinetobacter guillouiae]|uniref:hypothetical protein n=1 Tax=Acinetobacter TaxID=469 RepID=UPI001FB8A405|nr:hypothetical protein [Acinetobacter sp. NyZ410]UOH19941.1 hypothetical protein MTO68_07285 [Acinetobacter sp. NyZ410]